MRARSATRPDTSSSSVPRPPRACGRFPFGILIRAADGTGRADTVARAGVVSPDGRWLAYMSNESGQWEVYLSRLPIAEGCWQVSAAGGQHPLWNARGDRLCFVQGEELMEVDVGGTTAPVLGRPQRLFTRPPMGVGNFSLYRAYSMSREGDRFALVRGAGERGRAPGVTAVQNWLAEFLPKK